MGEVLTTIEVPPRTLWERWAPVFVGLGAVVIIVLLGTVVFLQVQQHQYTEDAHANTVSILNEHTNTLKEVADLRDEVTALVKQDGPALKAGQEALVAKLTWLECALATSATSCGAAP